MSTIHSGHRRPVILLRVALSLDERMLADINGGGVGDPGGNRTRDNLIKSQVLYRLSYRIKPLKIWHIPP